MTTELHTVLITDDEGVQYRFASPDGRTYLEMDYTAPGVTAEGLQDAIDNGRVDPKTGRRWVPMCFDRNFFKYASGAEHIKTIEYTDPPGVYA